MLMESRKLLRVQILRSPYNIQQKYKTNLKTKMHQLSSQQSSEEIKYNMFELVWAKITGYPWWPAKITGLPQDEYAEYKVQFIGDNSHAYLPVQKLAHYEEYRDHYSKPKKPVRNFYKSLEQAKQLYKQLSEDVAARQQILEASKSELQKQKQIIIQIEVQNKQSNKQSEYNPSQTNLKLKIDDLAQKNTRQQQSKDIHDHLNEQLPIKLRKTKMIVKNKKQQVAKLLKLYGLNRIPKYTQSLSSSFQFDCHKRRKKNNIQSSYQKYPLNVVQPDLRNGSIKKIYRMLKNKNIDKSQAQRISVRLIDQLPIESYSSGLQGITKGLFHWIGTSTRDIIQKDYHEWQKVESLTREALQEQNN